MPAWSTFLASVGAGYVYNGLKGRVQNFGSELNGILQGLLDLISR